MKLLRRSDLSSVIHYESYFAPDGGLVLTLHIHKNGHACESPGVCRHGITFEERAEGEPTVDVQQKLAERALRSMGANTPRALPVGAPAKEVSYKNVLLETCTVLGTTVAQVFFTEAPDRPFTVEVKVPPLGVAVWGSTRPNKKQAQQHAAQRACEILLRRYQATKPDGAEPVSLETLNVNFRTAYAKEGVALLRRMETQIPPGMQMGVSPSPGIPPPPSCAPPTPPPEVEVAVRTRQPLPRGMVFWKCGNGDAADPQHEVWDMYQNPNDGKYWWWHEATQRASFTDPTLAYAKVSRDTRRGTAKFASRTSASAHAPKK
jgi:hypothetical protein